MQRLSKSSLKAISLFIRKKVILSKATFSFFYFDVDGTEVTFNINKKYWSCTCRHESYRGTRKELFCYHIRACRYFLKAKGKGGNY